MRQKSSVTVRDGKTTKTRTVHLDSVIGDIADYLADKPDKDALFLSQRTGKPIFMVQAYRLLKRAGDLCDYDYIGTHTLRKTFEYHCFQHTKDIVTLIITFNHSSQNITKRYIGIEADDIKQSLKDFRL